jgi:hypothetical protein
VQALDKTSRFAIAAAMLDQGWQPSAESSNEAGNGVRRAFFQFSDVYPSFQYGAIGPDIRSAKVEKFEEPNIVGFHDINVPPCGDVVLYLWFLHSNQVKCLKFFTK